MVQRIGLFAGQDLAKRRDYAALEVIEVLPPQLHLNQEQPTARLVIDKQWPHLPYKQVVKDTRMLWRKYRWQNMLMDRGSAGDSVIEDYQALHLPVEPINFTAPTKHDMVQLLYLLLDKGRLKLPVKGADELKAQIKEQERNVGAHITYSHPENRHDDRFWALCLALKAASRYLTGNGPEPIVLSPKSAVVNKWLSDIRQSPGVKIVREVQREPRGC